jgi:L-threonylcarbamoyladenylate synthase
MVLDGGTCKNGIESTIIGFEKGEPIIYRLGALAIEDIEAVVGTVIIKNKKEENPDAPGMLDKHYAPLTATVLTTDIASEIKKHTQKKIGILAYNSSFKNDTVAIEIILSKNSDLQEAASKLYAGLHELDHLNLDVIIAEKLPETGLGKSINDRLQRAAFNS